MWLELTLKGTGDRITVNFNFVSSYVETDNGTEVYFNGLYQTVEESYKEIKRYLELKCMSDTARELMYGKR